MKSQKTTLLFGLFLLLFTSILAQPKINSVTPVTPSVGRYEKYELAIKLTNTTYTNPYDFAQTFLSCTFTAPSGAKKTIDGFWKKGQEITDLAKGQIVPKTADDGWFVRFSPTEVGTWTYSMTFKDNGGTSTAWTGSFFCASSTKNGFVRRQSDKNYFKFDNGVAYIPIGQNVGWYNANGIGDLKTWIDQMSINNANYLRFWLCYWGTELEWTPTSANLPYEGLKKYEQRRAFELDWLVDYALENEMYIDLCLQNHGQLQRPNIQGNFAPQWDTNPYSTTFGGPCASPSEFWTNATAKSAYKNKLRYILARWGYSPNIMSLELFNEMDLTENYVGNTSNATNWAKEMAAYLKTTDPNQRLITNSYYTSSIDSSLLKAADIDYNQVHYFDGIDFAAPPTHGNFQNLLADQALVMTTTGNKPFLNGSFGLFQRDAPSNSKEFDPKGVMLHNMMWSSLFNGSAGAGAPWFWDTYTHPLSNNAGYKTFKQLTDFAYTQMDVVGKNYKPIAPTYSGPGSYNAVDIMPQYAGFQPPTYNASRAPVNSFTFNANGVLTPSATFMSNILFGDFQPNERNPPTFNVNYPVAGQFRVNVINRDFSNTSTLVIILDGVTVLTQIDPGYNIYSVNIPAGQHTIKIDNTGKEWIQIGSIQLNNFDFSVPLTGNALQDGNYVVGWVLNRNYNWQYIRNGSGNLPPSVNNASLAVTSLSPNLPFIIKFFNIETNAVISTLNLTSNSAGVLTAPIPNLTWDMTYRIESNAPISVELLTFAGEAKPHNHILVKWTTSIEKNVSRFEVQKSTDAQNFSTIGTVTAVGQSQTLQNYQFDDPNAVDGINYYRLQTRDLENRISYSHTISVLLTSDKTLRDDPSVSSLVIYPNPTNEDVIAHFELKKYAQLTVSLSDLTGRIVKSFSTALNVGSQNLPIPMRDLPKGIYVLKMRAEEGQGVVRKIVKQ